MAGEVFHDVQTLTWNGTDISGDANEVVINYNRAQVSWANFGDDAMNKDLGARDESFTINAVYAEGAASAVEELLSSYEGSDGGSSGTLICQPKSGGTTYTGVGKVPDPNFTIGKGNVGRATFTVDVDGTISRS